MAKEAIQVADPARAWMMRPRKRAETVGLLSDLSDAVERFGLD